ncbi:MAG: PrsW family intramembrane metalloprotease [Chloroflexi bacterium]|nr:PrsW family intramembrane metalloprotease [Chloroflexota bacterium]
MTHDLCCVCNQPATRRIGQRSFCETHWASAMRESKSFTTASLAHVGLIVVFTLVVALGANALPPQFVESNLVPIGIVLAIIPAALWLSFFYRQDRFEPEPRHYVLSVFFIALLAADVLWRRVVADFFQLGDWVAANNLSAIVGNTLVVGFVLQGLIYAVVRFTVYPTAEFDERMDGIVYGTAAGLGVATMLNINFILESGGAELSAGVVHVVITALAQATFGGIVGYFMGEMKFTDEPAWWMPLGVAIAAVLNGLFNYLLIEVNQTGMQVSPWRGLLFALAVAVLTFAALIALIRRAIAHTLKQQPAQTGD